MRGPALVLALGVLASAGAAAHGRSTSWSSWSLEGREARVVLRVPQLELTRLPFGVVAPGGVPAELAEYVARTLRMTAGGEPCPVTVPPHPLTAPAERASIEWRVRCPVEGALAIESTFLLDVAPSHLHFARVWDAGGAPSERVLTRAETRWEIGAEDAGHAGGGLGTYLLLGIQHIATGYDHLVFLLGLLLLAVKIREVFTIVTGFTVAHSITLAAAALGRVRPDASSVEALIGLSIALVATENAWLLAGRPRFVPQAIGALLLGMAGLAAAGVGAIPATTLVGLAVFAACYFALVGEAERPARIRFAIAFCFGLVHGFGFAGVLQEVQIAREHLVPALLGFNLGVEAGQLVIVAAAWPLLRLAARAPRANRLGVEFATALICALGTYWLVSRAY